MNHDNLMFSTLAIAATLVVATSTVHAEYISPAFEAKLQAAADGGPADVNRLLYRTRAVYNISMDEAMQHVEQRNTDEASSEPSESPAGGGSGAVEAPSSPQDDAFTREFFRNDARD